jgi:hypothetical protein
MNRFLALTLLLGGAIAPLPVSLFLSPSAPMVGSRPAYSVQLSDGTVFFVSPPRLDTQSVYTTRTAPAARGATYYFTLEIPEDAGEPLQRLTITQNNGNTVRQRMRFQLDRSLAFVGIRRDRGENLPLETTFDDESQTLTLTFNPPVPPGTPVTVGIRPQHNPLSEGVYLLGITAYPPGDQVHGQFLGYGRLHFYRQDRLLFR